MEMVIREENDEDGDVCCSIPESKMRWFSFTS